MSAPNFYNWLHARRYGTAAMDESPDWDESKIRRTAKGGKGGGQFAKKPETLAKEDGRDVLNPSDGGGSRKAYSLTPSGAPQKASSNGGNGGGGQPSNPHLREVSAKEYADTIAAAKKACISPHAWRVDAYPADHYKNSLSRLVSDRGSCIAVQEDGDIVSLCKTDREVIPAKYLMAAAVEKGGDRLDTFEGNYELYRKCGFTPISWTPFNREYAPEGWAESGDPEEDVIFFAYTGDKKKFLSHEEAAADLAAWKASTKPCEGENGYDEAKQKRNDFIENNTKE